ncbi:hypothetical protein C8R43DRAFT_1176681 [Mycena crocata]|nr:hypothetical protein C8R43DRAFT_1176681 [Mycena crocata]
MASRLLVLLAAHAFIFSPSFSPSLNGACTSFLRLGVHVYKCGRLVSVSHTRDDDSQRDRVLIHVVGSPHIDAAAPASADLPGNVWDRLAPGGKTTCCVCELSLLPATSPPVSLHDSNNDTKHNGGPPTPMVMFHAVKPPACLSRGIAPGTAPHACSTLETWRYAQGWFFPPAVGSMSFESVSRTESVSQAFSGSVAALASTGEIGEVGGEELGAQKA